MKTLSGFVKKLFGSKVYCSECDKYDKYYKFVCLDSNNIAVKVVVDTPIERVIEKTYIRKPEEINKDNHCPYYTPFAGYGM